MGKKFGETVDVQQALARTPMMKKINKKKEQQNNKQERCIACRLIMEYRYYCVALATFGEGKHIWNCRLLHFKANWLNV